MPHLTKIFSGMKKSLLALLTGVLLTSVLGSCIHSDYDYTPAIYFSDFYANPIFSGDTLVGAEDTLLAHFDTLLNVYVLDTISLSDSIVFGAAFESFANYLTAARISFDTTALAFSANLESLRPIMSAKSNEKTLQLYFNPGYELVSFGVGYKAKKVGTHTIEVTAESDSEYSPTRYVLLQPVVE